MGKALASRDSNGIPWPQATATLKHRPRGQDEVRRAGYSVASSHGHIEATSSASSLRTSAGYSVASSHGHIEARPSKPTSASCRRYSVASSHGHIEAVTLL